jgi:predicted enzyme related to lactoylglutathione lyase
MLSLGELRLLLSKPGGGGGAGQSMPTGEVPAPGGWNRIQVECPDIDATVAGLKTTGAKFRNEVITGNGGKQCLVEDPSGNPIELFQPF